MILKYIRFHSSPGKYRLLIQRNIACMFHVKIFEGLGISMILKEFIR